MPWCEKCKCEYEKNVKNCADCGALLVDHLEEKQKSFESNKGEYVFLINVANMIETDIMISILELESIPSIKKFKSSGSYLNIASGFNYQGVDIFVPKGALDEARNVILVDSMLEQTEESQVNKDFDKLAKEYSNRRKSSIRIFIIIIVILPIIISISNLIDLL
jgi:hypothetical protein